MADLHQEQWEATAIYNDNPPAIIQKKESSLLLGKYQLVFGKSKRENRRILTHILPPDGATKLQIGKEQAVKVNILLGQVAEE